MVSQFSKTLEIPKEYFDITNPWCIAWNAWFYNSLRMNNIRFSFKQGVDKKLFFQQAKANMENIKIRQENKCAVGAYHLAQNLESIFIGAPCYVKAGMVENLSQ